MQALDKFSLAVVDNIVNPFIYLFSGLCFVWFLYGVVMFMYAKYVGKDDAGKSTSGFMDINKGKKHMLWGLIGLIIVFSAGAIYDFITGFFN
ncbi:MAG: hypothetical protein U0469_02060 [Candidatus Paceibacterota bacterium]|jgi:hypothetical protein